MLKWSNLLKSFILVNKDHYQSGDFIKYKLDGKLLNKLAYLIRKQKLKPMINYKNKTGRNFRETTSSDYFLGSNNYAI